MYIAVLKHKKLTGIEKRNRSNEVEVLQYRNTLNSAHFGGHNSPHYSKSALFEVTVK